MMPSSSKKISAPLRNCFGTIRRECVIKAYQFLVDLGQKDEKCQFRGGLLFMAVIMDFTIFQVLIDI
ncbi:hypothetical protein Hanom_Chr04g00303921 [Helianthus anomalus]